MEFVNVWIGIVSCKLKGFYSVFKSALWPITMLQDNNMDVYGQFNGKYFILIFRCTILAQWAGANATCV